MARRTFWATTGAETGSLTSPGVRLSESALSRPEESLDRIGHQSDTGEDIFFRISMEAELRVSRLSRSGFSTCSASVNIFSHEPERAAVQQERYQYRQTESDHDSLSFQGGRDNQEENGEGKGADEYAA